MKRKMAAAFLATTLLTAKPALAQDGQGAIQAELEAMRARIDALEAKLADTEARAAAAEQKAAQAEQKSAEVEKKAIAPSWKGAPQLASEDGWSFKPRGRIQYDAGWVSDPDGIDDRGLGFSNELRRLRFGAEGTIPGGFGYKFEIDVADNNVEVTDAILTYQASKALGFAIGQHNNFQSLEELTSSRFTSFMERAAFTDAFNFERRVGVSGGYASGDFLLNVGVFTDNINDLADNDDGTGLGDENDSVGADARLVYAPKLGDTQLHLGGSVHVRDTGDIAEEGTTTRYRQRPMIHTSNTRFLATPALTVTGETHYGLEAAVIRGPLHAAGEVHWLNASRLGTDEDPTFFGGYAEVGYFLTGETRGYKGGLWDRTKVRKPVGDGGAGAFQIVARYDHLDLVDAGIRGGRQNGYELSLVWIPQDYVRFLINYGHLDFSDAAIPAEGGDRDYSVDVIGARAQVDF